ncbi:hypothetical protein FHR83_006692 [Actinoplanes campanulatus]|uniref:Uncharacterized protein n=1 Tax=Actinoplanes campanulatus TaxID=113559 RepID=A0A7W5AMF8_9ACTN|nr:hypothetical protein [Actinoplanes campanulatus]MBB3098986.1 hypothetical protein [Actinoplanes campanulatus]GGN39558.1 hypothetical protein GCM10010109_67640 [Actinoplanes campanulatus]GID40146.1 hypothetical protein Aca09nite_66520 [Actinoplanes campanulatus]
MTRWIRRLTGTDILEEHMARIIDLLNGLVAQQTAASAAQATSFNNLHAAIDRLETAVRDGEASPEIEAAVGQLRDGFDALQKAADDADNGHEPQPDQPADGNEGDVFPEDTNR